MENADAANAQLDAFFKEDVTVDLPVISPPADNIVPLPGGLVRSKYGEQPVLLAREAEVRELNGADEEAIYKVRRNPYRLISTLLTNGTVMLGDHHPNADMLKNLLIGDRDAIILGIRRATFGDEVELGEFICPGCEENLGDLKVTLDDIPVKTLDDPLADTQFKVDLWKGGHAKVRLPNGHDQEAVAALDLANESEVNTMMLSRCVLSITKADGTENVTANNAAAVNALGVKDRKAILAQINDRQPGPRYDEVKFTHDSCGKETPLFLTVGDLFREL